MEVILAKSAGFCFGVKRAVETVYEQTETGVTDITYKRCYSLSVSFNLSKTRE